MTDLTLHKTGSSSLWGKVGVSGDFPHQPPPHTAEWGKLSAKKWKQNWAVLLTEVFSGSWDKGSHGLIQFLVTTRVEGAFHEQVCGKVGHGLVHSVSLLPLHQFLFNVALQHVHSFLKEKTGPTGPLRRPGFLGRVRPLDRLMAGKVKVHMSQGCDCVCMSVFSTRLKAPWGLAPSLFLFHVFVLTFVSSRNTKHRVMHAGDAR